MAVARQEIGIGAAHRAEQQPVAHRAAVDEEILHLRVGAVVGRQPGKARRAGTPSRSASTAHGVVGEVAAHDGGEPRQRALPADRRWLAARRMQRAAPSSMQGEGDVGPRHGEALDHVDDRQRFAARRLQEFQPRRRGEEKIAHLDARAGRRLCRRRRLAPCGRPRRRWPGAVAALARGDDRQPRHGADRRQRLAAKAERGDVGQVVAPSRRASFEVAWRSTASASVLGVMPAPSSSTAISARAAVAYGHLDAACAGIERVLDQLLHRARRALDHLARGDAVDASSAAGGCASRGRSRHALPCIGAPAPCPLRPPAGRTDRRRSVRRR